MKNTKVECLYTGHFLSCIYAYMVQNDLVMYIDTSNTLWHIKDFKGGIFCPEELQAQKDQML